MRDALSDDELVLLAKQGVEAGKRDVCRLWSYNRAVVGVSSDRVVRVVVQASRRNIFWFRIRSRLASITHAHPLLLRNGDGVCRERRAQNRT